MRDYASEDRNAQAHPHSQLYQNSRWRLLRARVLRDSPLCVYCEQAGRVTAATVVDHIRPHRGDLALFWERANLQPLCATCHNGLAGMKDTHGFAAGVGLNGEPLDPEHPWYRERGT